MRRIGFVGGGLIAWAHAIGLAEMTKAGIVEAEFVAVYDIDSPRAQSLAGALGTRAVDSLDEVIERCDTLWVCTPTAAHPEAVLRAAQHGCAVFCEKPLAINLATVMTMAETVAAAAVPAQVGLVLRSTPVFRALRDLVAAGALGAPMVVVFRDDQYFPIQGLYGSTWRGHAEMAGGGCLIEHSIHDLDILRFCLGDVTEVSCWTSNLSGKGDVEDVASVSLRFASGATANLTSVWHDILSRGSGRRVEMFFENGLAWFDNDFRGPIHVETVEGTEILECHSPPWVDDLPLARDEFGLAIALYVEADRAFADAIRDGMPPGPDLAEAVVAHQLVDASYRSAAAHGGPISIP